MPEPSYCLHCGHALTRRELGGHTRFVCTAADCSFIHWNNPVPVVAAVIVSEDRSQVLLVRNVGWPAKVFALVTGFLEHSESPAEAAAREVLEETSLVSKGVKWLGNYPFAAKNQLLLGYEVLVDQSAPITLNEELEEYKWIPAARLKPWPFGTGDAVRDWIELHVGSND